MGLKIKLIASTAGASDTQLRTILGLGLRKLGQSRLLKDNGAIRGMIFKVKHLVSQELVNQDPPPHPRRKPSKILVRDRARAKRSSISTGERKTHGKPTST